MDIQINDLPIDVASTTNYYIQQFGNAPGGLTSRFVGGQAKNPNKTVIVDSPSDLPAPTDTLDGNGLGHRLEDETLYLFGGQQEYAYPLIFPAFTTLTNGCVVHGMGNGYVKYTGTGAFLRAIFGTDSYVYRIFCIGDGSNTLLDFEGDGNLFLVNLITRDFADLGTIKKTAFSVLDRIGFNSFTTDGIKFIGGLSGTGLDTGLVMRDTSFFYGVPMFGGTIVDLNGSFTFVQINSMRANIIIFDYLFNIDPATFTVNGLINDIIVVDFGGDIFKPGSLDQTANRWVYSRNIAIPDSQAVSESKMLTNGTVTNGVQNVPIKVAGVFVPYYTERFTADTTGRHTYTGITTVTKSIEIVNRAKLASGTNKIWEFYIAEGNDVYNWITEFADAGGGLTSVTTLNAHGYATNTLVRLFGTTNYNKAYVITVTSANSFTIVAPFVVDDTLTPNTAITAFADNGSGGTTVSSAGHTLVDGDYSKIVGTTNYNGVESVFNVVAGVSFDIDVGYIVEAPAGNVSKLTEQYLLLSATNESLMGNNLSSGDTKASPTIESKIFKTNDFIEFWAVNTEALSDAIFDKVTIKIS